MPVISPVFSGLVTQPFVKMEQEHVKFTNDVSYWGYQYRNNRRWLCVDNYFAVDADVLQRLRKLPDRFLSAFGDFRKWRKQVGSTTIERLRGRSPFIPTKVDGQWQELELTDKVWKSENEEEDKSDLRFLKRKNGGTETPSPIVLVQDRFISHLFSLLSKEGKDTVSMATRLFERKIKRPKPNYGDHFVLVTDKQKNVLGAVMPLGPGTVSTGIQEAFDEATQPA